MEFWEMGNELKNSGCGRAAKVSTQDGLSI